MAIRGSLREAGAVDILQLLALGRKTGCLSLSDGTSFGRVYLQEGMITHASIINRPDRLGELLVKNEIVSAIDVERAMSEQARSGKRLGEILVAEGSAARDDVDQLIRLQIEEAVYLLFTWSQGQFHFEPNELPPPEELRVRLHPESLLLEGARRVDEWAVIEKKISSPSLVLALDLTHGVPQYEDLSTEQRRVLMLVDERRTVGEIVAASGLLEFEGYRAVHGLLQAGYLRPHASGAREPSRVEASAGAEELRNLAIAFRRTGMLGEARRELLQILELDPGDSAAKLSIAEIELLRGEHRSAARRAMEVARSRPEAKEPFYLVALALEGASRLGEAEATLDAALARHPTDPDLLLSHAIIRTRMGDLPGACEAFLAYEAERGDEASPPPAYFIYSVLAFAGVGRGDAAALRARAGIRRYPRNAPLLTNSAALAERRGELKDAEDLFRRAVEIDPSMRQARRGLASVLLSRGADAEAARLLEGLAEESSAHATARPPMAEVAKADASPSSGIDSANPPEQTDHFGDAENGLHRFRASS